MLATPRFEDSPPGKILKHLQQHGTCRIKDLEASLGVTRTAVWQPLTTLLAAELVTAVAVRQGRGRPYTVYRLSSKGQSLFPRLYGNLALAMLEEMLTRVAASSLPRLLHRISVRLGKQYAAQIRGTTLGSRLHALLAWLATHGIYGSVQEEDHAFVLTEYGCPFYGLAQHHQEICVMETDALALALNAPVTLQESQRHGHHCCRFLVQKSGPLHASKPMAVASPCAG